MPNFISEDDVEKALATRLREAGFGAVVMLAFAGKSCDILAA